MAVAFFAALTEHPGRWAKVTYRDFGTPQRAQAYASVVNRGRGPNKAIGGAFEAVVRGGDVYVRFAGE